MSKPANGGFVDAVSRHQHPDARICKELVQRRLARPSAPPVDGSQKLVSCPLFHPDAASLPLWMSLQGGCHPALVKQMPRIGPFMTELSLAVVVNTAGVFPV